MPGFGDIALPSMEELNSSLKRTIPSAHWMGMKTVGFELGRSAIHAPIAQNGNHFGVMYAGALFTAAEMLGGLLAISAFDQSVFYPLVKNVSIDFLAPVTTDIRAEAQLSLAEYERMAQDLRAHGKAEYVVEATVTDESGRLVATTNGTYQVRPVR